MWNSLYQFVGALIARARSEGGQTMAEYALLIVVIAIIVLVAATFLGGQISSVFDSLGSSI